MEESKIKEIPSCVLSDKNILDELGDTVIIEPFNKDQVGPNSYDITLGDYYYVGYRNKNQEFFNPFNGEHISEYWGVTPDKTTNYGAEKALIITTQNEAKKYGLKIGDRYIIIKAGHIILAHTNEFIGGRKNVTTMMKARSTIGRAGLTICSCAGCGDVGYFNRYTYEIHNRNPIPVVLKVGDRIGQIVFMRTGEVLVSYEKRGQYQTSDIVEQLMANWTPLTMIPKNGIEYIQLESKEEQSEDEFDKIEVFESYNCKRNILLCMLIFLVTCWIFSLSALITNILENN